MDHLQDKDLPEGFDYVPEFVTEDEEQAFIEFCEAQDLGRFVYAGTASRREVKNYGVNFDYEKKVPFLDGPIPEIFQPMVNRVAARLGVPQDRMVELLITIYPDGAGINWHRDSRPFESIAAVSLLNDAPLQLRPAPTKRDRRTPITKLTVERRSLYLLQGPARTAWMHRVPPVKAPRISLTMRTVRPQWDIVGSARPDGVPLHFDR